ncbi:hypothetical protein Q9Q94_02950 [Uliginosibacterium sp. 31-16]|uniref:hypothetical protein n=1 Tax=Uliginosibacterium sp. 31-16 TaxID=3068315 RepID=UPI00273D5716|nr:hypothetical protein [Uliginosibacterium sp. 31-16]MDP5238468.1 hypothetical protein [Uliginosibacterium sp. 31-16]
MDHAMNFLPSGEWSRTAFVLGILFALSAGALTLSGEKFPAFFAALALLNVLSSRFAKEQFNRGFLILEASSAIILCIALVLAYPSN